MTRTKKMLVGLGMIAAVGAFGLAPRADAMTTKTPVVCKTSGATSMAFVQGEDGRIWYTITDFTGGAAPYALTALATAAVNPGNPFATSLVRPNGNQQAGFVDPATLPGGTNVTIWEPIGTFVAQSAPSCVNTALGDNVMILVAGLDNRIWHTVFDGDDAGLPPAGDFNDAGVLTSGVPAASSGCWAAAAEGAVDDGWAGTIPGGCSPVGPFIPLP